MDTLLFTLHLLMWPLCIMIVTLILLQGGAGDISSAFGGGGQLDSTLGVGASRKMAKLTGWLAALFAATVITLAIPFKGTIERAQSPTAIGAHDERMTAPAAASHPTGSSLPLSAPANVATPGNPSPPPVVTIPVPPQPASQTSLAPLRPVPAAGPAPAPAPAPAASTPAAPAASTK